ncbi:hypothetical protein [Alcanivorax sp.]|uniref:hypothetical protein n=1 Tax=Alcanivorax sp. TaxID=1872427 RepID=UPI002B270125|nr:hypothetical protein [Alcanivorax sp.]
MNKYTVQTIAEKYNVPEGIVWSLSRKVKKLGYSPDIYLEPLVKKGAEKGVLGDKNISYGWPPYSPFDKIEGIPIDGKEPTYDS